MFQTSISVQTRGKGLYSIASLLLEALEGQLQKTGLVNIFLQHTSASLTIQENADPSARHDLEQFFERLVPDGQFWHTHTLEGPDDTTSHMKSALTLTSLTVPVSDGKLALGVWQGIYLWEHRKQPHRRNILITLSP
jgi:secondary thiamine-phosphate synthase enzyme